MKQSRNAMRLTIAMPLIAVSALPQPAMAQVAVADSGDTAWMILCALLVLMAGLPGLMLRYAGQVNVRNALSIVAQGAAVAATASLCWAIIGYSLSFGPGGAWLGGGANLLLANLGQLRDGLTIPESAFVLFQLAAALLTTCLLLGAVAERARIGWLIAFTPLWLLLVYAPIARAVWGGGWLAAMGVMDFAGGLVVQATAGFSGLALAIIAGRLSESSVSGHAPLLSIIGGAFIWVGLSGLVGGWALGATDDAATAILNLHLAACAGALGWALIDRVTGVRSSATGILSGGLTAIAAICASAALVGTGGAMLIGLAGVAIARIGKKIIASRVDDGDHFVIHGLGGVAGTLLLPVFTLPMLGGVGFDTGITVNGAMVAQVTGVVIVGLWAMVGTTIAALIISTVMPMRLSPQDEANGLDAAQHGQQGWDFR